MTGERTTRESFYRGVLLATGEERDYAAAADEFRAAAEHEFAGASFNLGLLYDFGCGVAADAGAARSWYGRAAELGCSRALFPLGLAHHFGRGGAVDMAEAVRWYRRAAERGDGDAMVNLGLLYLRGEGVGQDFAEAFTWLASAVGLGRQGARAALEIAEDAVSGRGAPTGELPAPYVTETPAVLCGTGRCLAEPCPLEPAGIPVYR